jgi:tRNA threonylcarbamoyladenosine biosynthesis protein TsaB
MRRAGLPWPRRRTWLQSAAVQEPVSIAIETSCRRGGVAVGAGDGLLDAAEFPSDRRHAVQLVPRLAELLGRHGLEPSQVGQVYVCVGPGSFTGLRVGVTVARTLAQGIEGLKLVAVPTVEAVAENFGPNDAAHVAVVLDAKYGQVYAALFRPSPDGPVEVLAPRLAAPEGFLAECPRPVVLAGEGLAYHRLEGTDVSLAPENLGLPSSETVWRAGRRRAEAGKFIPLNHLLPIYLRKPEAVRLWESRQGRGEPPEK